jgi:predicted ribosomally synthesized peptide with nif11-like leader
MSEAELSRLLAKIKEDVVLRDRFMGAASPEAAVAIAVEAGFNVAVADLLRPQLQLAAELTDQQLEASVSGGGISVLGTIWLGCCGEYVTANADFRPNWIC